MFEFVMNILIAICVGVVVGLMLEPFVWPVGNALVRIKSKVTRPGKHEK